MNFYEYVNARNGILRNKKENSLLTSGESLKLDIRYKLINFQELSAVFEQLDVYNYKNYLLTLYRQ